MKKLQQDDRGMGTIEIVLIIVVLVGLVIIFKEQLTGLVEGLFEKIVEQTSKM